MQNNFSIIYSSTNIYILKQLTNHMAYDPIRGQKLVLKTDPESRARMKEAYDEFRKIREEHRIGQINAYYLMLDEEIRWARRKALENIT